MPDTPPTSFFFALLFVRMMPTAESSPLNYSRQNGKELNHLLNDLFYLFGLIKLVSNTRIKAFFVVIILRTCRVHERLFRIEFICFITNLIIPDDEFSVTVFSAIIELCFGAPVDGNFIFRDELSVNPYAEIRL